ncbi:hypothetical protein AQ611_17745 [Burkholderia singularis]|nr:hypothetical protein AQ611_17745 [Burkholderia sp. Bp7605]
MSTDWPATRRFVLDVILRYELIQAHLANSELAADLLDLRTQLGLLQGKCDLLFRKLARLHSMAFVSAWTHHAEFLYFCTGLFLGSGSIPSP